MNALLLTASLALGQGDPAAGALPSTALDGVWTIVAAEINGRPVQLSEKGRSLAIHNNSLTLPGVAAMHGTLRLELGPKGTLRAVPAAAGTGNRRDPAVAATTGPGANSSGLGTSGTGVFVRTADYLVLTIGDPSAATATGTGVGSTNDPSQPTEPDRTPAPGSGTTATVGQPPVSLVLRRATGADAPPSTAATPPPAAPNPTPPPAPQAAAPEMRRVSSVMGSNVTLNDGSAAGRIEDMVYGNGGTIDYAVLGSNGAFTAVPWIGLNWTAANGSAMLPLTRDQFGRIPTFGANAWSQLLTDAAFMQRLQTTFNGFQDANGRPLFNQMTSNSLNRTGNQGGVQTNNQSTGQTARPANPATTPPGNQPTTPQNNNPQRPQPGTQPINQPRPQPGTAPGQQNVPPGGQPGTKPPAQQKVPPNGTG
jgi:hypothetical protein